MDQIMRGLISSRTINIKDMKVLKISKIRNKTRMVKISKYLK